MNYKKILNVVGVAAVAVVLSVGCSDNFGDCQYDTDPASGQMVAISGGCEADNNKPDDGGGGGSGGLVGDWLLQRDGKVFYSFKSSNSLVLTAFEEIGDFWTESSVEIGKYSIKDDSVCVIIEGEEDCIPYSVSDNYLSMIGESCHYYYDNGEEVEECYPDTMTFVRSNVTTFKNFLGDLDGKKVYGKDPALGGMRSTMWTKPSESGDGDDYLFIGGNFSDDNNVYIDASSGDATWYTEGSRLTLVKLECVRWVGGDRWNGRCVEYSVSQTVTLDYELANGTLRLRADGRDWDTWTQYFWDDGDGHDDDGGMYKSKAKAKSPKSKRSVNTFFKISKK